LNGDFSEKIRANPGKNVEVIEAKGVEFESLEKLHQLRERQNM